MWVIDAVNHRLVPAGGVPVKVVATIFVDAPDCLESLIEGTKKTFASFLSASTGGSTVDVSVACTKLVKIHGSAWQRHHSSRAHVQSDSASDALTAHGTWQSKIISTLIQLGHPVLAPLPPYLAAAS